MHLDGTGSRETVSADGAGGGFQISPDGREFVYAKRVPRPLTRPSGTLSPSGRGGKRRAFGARRGGYGGTVLQE